MIMNRLLQEWYRNFPMNLFCNELQIVRHSCCCYCIECVPHGWLWFRFTDFTHAPHGTKATQNIFTTLAYNKTLCIMKTNEPTNQSTNRQTNSLDPLCIKYFGCLHKNLELHWVPVCACIPLKTETGNIGYTRPAALEVQSYQTAPCQYCQAAPILCLWPAWAFCRGIFQRNASFPQFILAIISTSSQLYSSGCHGNYSFQVFTELASISWLLGQERERGRGWSPNDWVISVYRVTQPTGSHVTMLKLGQTEVNWICCHGDVMETSKQRLQFDLPIMTLPLDAY